MNSQERACIALEGGRPDRVPIACIYDVGYVAKVNGVDMRHYNVCTPQQRIDMLERVFLRHPQPDIHFVHVGVDAQYLHDHDVEKHEGYWLITHRGTGKQHRLLPDGNTAQADGTPNLRNPTHGGESRIQSYADLDTVVPQPASRTQLEANGRYAPLRYLSTKYPDRHFSFQLGSPMVFALNYCGGYEEGLLTMAENRELFRALLERCARREMALIDHARECGARSAWFTSYYTGADTLSPRDYVELVYPFDRMVCQAVKEAGLPVLHWYLGDLMPRLDQVMQLPTDALVLEQGRKTYEIDPVAIRGRVGERFCLFGYGYENDYCTFNRDGLSRELRRQFDGAGRGGAFVAGVPIMPPNANSDAVDFYFDAAMALRY